MQRQFKIFADPVHGFIMVPKGLVLELVQHPIVQRLRRIRQLGVGHLVFPGAEHTRFGHALGAMALMHEALLHLREKGVSVHEEEFEAALIAALLHDVGHAPFSHTLEPVFIEGFQHEQMSRALMDDLNHTFSGRLELALGMFDRSYPRPFFHELISSQLDVDRLDYLRRDSFYTGVSEGKVGVGRILKTLTVFPPDSYHGRLAVEEKGIYAIENFLIARKLMYWQVYLHKTVLAGDQVLRALFLHARKRVREDGPTALPSETSPTLRYFLEKTWKVQDIQESEVRRRFCLLDDSDILFSLKHWAAHPDPVLADLARRFTNRHLFRVVFLEESPSEAIRSRWRNQVADWLLREGLCTPSSLEEILPYYLHIDSTSHHAYEPDNGPIYILQRDGELCELTATRYGHLLKPLSALITRTYVCYPKEVPLAIPT